MKKITLGILAHVDAGKTTLCEALLYTCNAIKKLGRVDNRDSFLDTHFEERKRGITIFSKQARLNYKDMELTIIDTPGHSDFSSEMERSLSILDYALLIISATDGVQSHTMTLISLLEKYNIPVFIFVTKMDVAKISKEELIENIRQHIKTPIIDFSSDIDFEAVAESDEYCLDKYLECGLLENKDIANAINLRKFIPCYFGSGLKLDGIEKLLNGIYYYTASKNYSDNFSARVFKIAHDVHNKRLSFIKLYGGSLKVRDCLGNDKITEIRLYSGAKFESVNEVFAGDVCAVTGLNSSYSMQCLGNMPNDKLTPYLKGVLNYTVILPSGIDPFSVLPKFRELEEEDPALHVVWNESSRVIELELMGQVQIDVLSSIISDRFGINVSFSSGRIMYKETIRNVSEGVGHYEPLKHYAEVHLLLSPLERNSGIFIENCLGNDELDINYRNLILSHIYEKTHLGVLTGSPITDIKISLIGAKAHLKHTEGGDFRQATYRAIRQGLMKADCILLEPLYEFYLEVPAENIGRAIADIHQMEGVSDSPQTVGNYALIHGTAPVRLMCNYMNEVLSYTNGKGRLSLSSAGYKECPDANSIIEDIAYNPVSDLNNSPDSIFCSHGAGITIAWNEVDSYCHIPTIKQKETVTENNPVRSNYMAHTDIDEAELESIMLREFGPIKRKKYTEQTVIENKNEKREIKPVRIIIDGYNVIYSWDFLKEIASESVDAAREKLINMLINYSAFTSQELILVFDAYLVKGGEAKKYDESKLHIVFTKEGQSADAYIEQLIDEIGKNINVKVVSSDSMIQLTAVKSGVVRISSREFLTDVSDALENMRRKING